MKSIHFLTIMTVLGCLLTWSIPARSVTIINDKGITQQTSNKRRVRGEIISFKKNVKLVTTVGTFQLDPTIPIKDLRTSSSSVAKVVIQFRGDSIVEVIIYE